MEMSLGWNYRYNMKLTVTRIFEPITKTFDDCHDCPWFGSSNEGNFTLEICNHPKFSAGKPTDGLYDKVIPDITQRWKSNIPKISKRCPFRDEPK